MGETADLDAGGTRELSAFGGPRYDILGEAETITQRQKHAKQKAFLEAFAVCGVIGSASKTAGVSRAAVNYWRDNDPEFAHLFTLAEEDAADAVEAEVHRRGVQGFQEPVIFQGIPSMTVDAVTGEERVLTVTRFSDMCLLALVKARRPEKFRENSTVTHQGGSGVLVVPGAVAVEDWTGQAAKHQAQWAGNRGQLEPPTIDGEAIPAEPDHKVGA